MLLCGAIGSDGAGCRSPVKVGLQKQGGQRADGKDPSQCSGKENLSLHHFLDFLIGQYPIPTLESLSRSLSRSLTGSLTETALLDISHITPSTYKYLDLDAAATLPLNITQTPHLTRTLDTLD